MQGVKLICYSYIATTAFLRQTRMGPEEAEKMTADLVNGRVNDYLADHPELVAEGERQIIQTPIRYVDGGDDDDGPHWEECDVVDASAFKFTAVQPARILGGGNA